jgi:hypothetical protein
MKKLSLFFTLLLTVSAFSLAQAQENALDSADFTARLASANVNFKTLKTETDLNKPNFSTLERKQTASSSAQSTFKYVRPSAKERAKRYANRVVGPVTLLATAAFAGIAHAADEPEEWEGNFKGYARRFGSNLGRNAIEETVIYGLDETFRVDSSFYKKGKGEKTNKRIANALLSAVTARTPSGKRVVGFPRIIGNYAGAVIAFEAWHPDRFDYKDGLRSGTISLGVNALVNLFREFVLPGK